jgi:plasmid stabilization system protein ParE
VQAAVDLLARHPYAGKRARQGRDRYRLALSRTPFVILYLVDATARVVIIVELMHEHARRATR